MQIIVIDAAEILTKGRMIPEISQSQSDLYRHENFAYSK